MSQPKSRFALFEKPALLFNTNMDGDNLKYLITIMNNNNNNKKKNNNNYEIIILIILKEK